MWICGGKYSREYQLEVSIHKAIRAPLLQAARYNKFFGNDLIYDFFATIDMVEAYVPDPDVTIRCNKSFPAKLIEIIRSRAINEKK